MIEVGTEVYVFPNKYGIVEGVAMDESTEDSTKYYVRYEDGRLTMVSENFIQVLDEAKASAVYYPTEKDRAGAKKRVQNTDVALRRGMGDIKALDAQRKRAFPKD
jgi:hypothetical protein